MDKEIYCFKKILQMFNVHCSDLKYYKSVQFDDEAGQSIYTGTAIYNGKRVHVVVKWGDAGTWFALFNNELAAKRYADEVIDFGWEAQKCNVCIVIVTKLMRKMYFSSDTDTAIDELNQQVKVNATASVVPTLSLLKNNSSLIIEFEKLLYSKTSELIKDAEIHDIETDKILKIRDIDTTDIDIEYYIDDNNDVVEVSVTGIVTAEDGQKYIIWYENPMYKVRNLEFKGAKIPLRVNVLYQGVSLS